MPCFICKQLEGASEIHAELLPDEWRLTPQVEALEAWLREHAAELTTHDDWSADIGFNGRPDATGGGPVITRAFMRLCLATNLDLYLSEYGVDNDAE